MGRIGYGIVTERRWLWPLVDLGAVLLFAIQRAVIAHETKRGRL